jgi:hypothetical protein
MTNDTSDEQLAQALVKEGIGESYEAAAEIERLTAELEQARADRRLAFIAGYSGGFRDGRERRPVYSVDPALEHYLREQP